MIKGFWLIYRWDLSLNSSGCNIHCAAVSNKSRLLLLISQRWMDSPCHLFLCVCPVFAKRLVAPLPRE